MRLTSLSLTSSGLVLLLLLLEGVLQAGGQGLDLNLLADGPGQPKDVFGNPALNLQPAEYWFDGGVTAAPELNINGGVVDDKVDLMLYSATLDAIIYYTIGKEPVSTPQPLLNSYESVGTVFDGKPIRLTSNFAVKAFALHLLSADSEVTTTDQIYVRVLPPRIEVLEGPEEGTKTIVITANTSNPDGEPSITYTLDGTDPQGELVWPFDGLLESQGVGEVRFVLYRTRVVKAIAFQRDMAPSLVTSSGVIETNYEGGDLELGWEDSMAWWQLGNHEYYFGEYSRPRRSWGGSCSEQYATLVNPARVMNREGSAGALVLLGPSCKGGLWDVDPEGISSCEYHPLAFDGRVGYQGREEEVVVGSPLCNVSTQPQLNQFREQHRGVWGLKFDGMLNRGLYVSEDIEMQGLSNLPLREFTVEAQVAIEPAALMKSRLHGLLAVQQDTTGVSQGRYQKGWSLLYTTDSVQGLVTFSFAVSVAANNDINNHGRFQVARTYPIKPLTLINPCTFSSTAEIPCAELQLKP